MGDTACGHVQINLKHQFLEPLAIFASLDSIGFGPDHLYTMFFKHPSTEEFHGCVEARLSAECGEQCEFSFSTELFHLGQFTHDDFLHRFGCYRLDVGAVGKLRVGHDGGWVGVHQHHAIALLPECLAGLSARIVKLARLPDDNGSCADD